MVTNLKLNLSDEERQAIHLFMTGKPGLATRKMIQEFYPKVAAAALSPGGGKTVLKTMVCPKCQKPIGVNVPAPASDVPKEPEKAASGSTPSPELKKATADAAAALKRLSEVLP